MKVKSLLLNGDSNVGLHVYATNEYVLLGLELSKNDKKSLEEVFGVPIHNLTIAGTSLLGVFLSGNNNNLIVPGIIFDSEKKKLDNLGIKYQVLDTELTCLGNNMVCNENSAIIHVDFSKKEKDKIKEILGLKEIVQGTIAEIETVGSCVVMNNKGGVIHRFASSEEIKKLEKLFNIKLGIATVNLGSPLVRSGVACNDNGFIIGSHSGGPEMVNVDENLGGLNE